MADIAVNDVVKLHGWLEGKVISKTDVDPQHFVVIEYKQNGKTQTTIREIGDLVEESANVFTHTGGPVGHVMI